MKTINANDKLARMKKFVVDGAAETSVVSAHINKDLAKKFRIKCAQKGIKKKEALALIIEQWLSQK